MEITRIKNVKDFPIVEQSEISEVLAYDAEGNLIRAKYDEPEVDIDLSDYYNKSETDDIVDKLEKDIADASAALLGDVYRPYYETIRGAVAIGNAAQAAAETADAKADVNAEDIRQLNSSVASVYSSLNQWKNDTKESLESELEDWVSETDALAKDAKKTADAAQAAAETADAKADVNAEDIRQINEWVDIAQTTIDAAWATAKDSNEKATAAETTANNAQTTANNAQNTAWSALSATETNDARIDVLETTIGDINNILSSL